MTAVGPPDCPTIILRFGVCDTELFLAMIIPPSFLFYSEKGTLASKIMEKP